MSGIAATICFYGCFYGCLVCCDACILWSWLKSNQNFLKSLLRFFVWLIINYYIFRFFGWNEYIFNFFEIVGISDEVVELESSVSNFLVIRYAMKIYEILSYVGYWHSTYNWSLIVPILLWINPLQTIGDKASSVCLLLNWNILYIYSATLDENSQYGKIFPSIYPILHILASYWIYWKRYSLLSSSNKSNINWGIGINQLLVFASWVFLFSKIYYGSLSAGILEIIKLLFWIFTEYIVLYLVLVIYVLLFTRFGDEVYENSYACKVKGKNLQQIGNFALSELFGFFVLIILTIFLYWTYYILDILFNSPWILTEGFVFMLAYIATLWMSFSSSFGSIRNSDVWTWNFAAFYMELTLVRFLFI
ncbi:unnamed protein product [Blepharisma stoltei]|uniref:Uncharacterized protein n=1 Tax=Blepharisma stoltei TaxID=1481888 RepID=A0AAU9IH19_9CILI|nr:unnamed protein product [Blepharisma stoltei]